MIAGLYIIEEETIRVGELGFICERRSRLRFGWALVMDVELLRGNNPAPRLSDLAFDVEGGRGQERPRLGRAPSCDPCQILCGTMSEKI